LWGLSDRLAVGDSSRRKFHEEGFPSFRKKKKKKKKGGPRGGEGDFWWKRKRGQQVFSTLSILMYIKKGKKELLERRWEKLVRNFHGRTCYPMGKKIAQRKNRKRLHSWPRR